MSSNIVLYLQLYNLFSWKCWFKKIIWGKKCIVCKIFVMQELYISMRWNLLTLTFHKESFVLGQKMIHHLSWVMTLLMKVNQKLEKMVFSHWQQAGTNYILPVHELSCTRRCLQCTIVHTKIVLMSSCTGAKLSAKTSLCQAVYKIQIRTNPQCLMLAIVTFNLLFFEAIPCKSVQYWVPMSKLHASFWDSSWHVFVLVVAGPF